MKFFDQNRQWFAALERSDLSGHVGGLTLPDKSGEVADKSDLYKEIADLDR